MLWLNSHSRTRKRLSPYIDGQLSPREKEALEAHLAGCDACRRELNELRAVISAVGGLADAAPPRSFSLTPGMLERRAAAPAVGVPPLANGMRLAGAGVAFVLSVVLIGDFASMSGGGSGSDDGGMRQAAEIQMSNADDAGSAPYAAPAATGTAEGDAFVGEDRAAQEELSSSADTAEPCAPDTAQARDDAQGTQAGGVRGPVAAEPTPVPEPAPTSAREQPSEAIGATVECAPAAADIAPEEGSPAVVEPLRDGDEGESASAPESVADDDAGVSTLTVIEIILAGGLVALVAAIAIEYAMRRRTA